jgi:hypothetical protein
LQSFEFIKQGVSLSLELPNHTILFSQIVNLRFPKDSNRILMVFRGIMKLPFEFFHLQQELPVLGLEGAILGVESILFRFDGSDTFLFHCLKLGLNIADPFDMLFGLFL